MSESPLILAVGGGKGGVGKTMVSANLALALSKLGARVIAVDADLGGANLHMVLGVEKPRMLTLQGVLDGRLASLQEGVVGTPYPRLELVAGSVAVPGAANPQHARKAKLLRHLRRLDTEIVVVDCGAGIHFNVVDFAAAADALVVVANAQLVSLQKAYGFTKAVVYRSVRQLTATSGVSPLDALLTGSETETLPEVLGRLWATDAALATHLSHLVEHMHVTLLGNQLADLREQGTLHALSRMMGDFLGLHPKVAGGLRRTDAVHASISRRRPLLADDSSSPEARALLALAESFMELDLAALRRSLREREPIEAAATAANRVVSSTPPPLPAPLGSYARAHERHDVDWPATLEVDGRSSPARVRDVSAGGACLRLALPPPQGARLTIVFQLGVERIAIAARIVRSQADEAGALFDPAPSASALARLLTHAERAGAPKASGSAARASDAP